MHPEQPAVPAGRGRPRPRWATASTVTAVGIVLAALAVPAVAAPATAAAAPTPFLNCVISKNDGTYRAIFGYTNPGPRTTLPRGSGNAVGPEFLDGIQTTKFRSGTEQSAFATPFVSEKYTVTWTVAGSSAEASRKDTACGADVVLPTEGNGIGPILVLVLSMLFSFMLNALRTWRLRRRSA